VILHVTRSHKRIKDVATRRVFESAPPHLLATIGVEVPLRLLLRGREGRGGERKGRGKEREGEVLS